MGDYHQGIPGSRKCNRQIPVSNLREDALRGKIVGRVSERRQSVNFAFFRGDGFAGWDYGKARVEFAGAVNHVLDRGDRGEPIFRDDRDREAFLAVPGQACGRTGWLVHASGLMGNHYHLLIETGYGRGQMDRSPLSPLLISPASNITAVRRSLLRGGGLTRPRTPPPPAASLARPPTSQFPTATSAASAKRKQAPAVHGGQGRYPRNSSITWPWTSVRRRSMPLWRKVSRV